MRTPIVVTTEQAVDFYNATHQPNPAAAIEPAEGTMVMDYPLVPTTRDLMAAKPSTRSGSRCGEVGHRDPQAGRLPGTGGVLPKLLPFPTPAQVTSAAAVG